jgi:tRNA U34 5-carboxymethylaminomethyl modifying GTPase MnmE/TrmE
MQEPVLTYSAEILDRELLEASEDFTVTFQAESLARLFGKAVTKEIAAAHRGVKERLSSPFSIMVVGDFKRGKSTLINALVGQEVAPVDVQPETLSINRIEYAEEFTARLQSKDGGEATLAREDLKRERLEPLLRRLATPLRHLRIGVPADLLKKVTLVDTPGLGDLFKEFDQAVREYMEQADTIVYVLSSTSPLSSTEQDFLLSTIAPRHFPKVFFLVNSVDVFNNAGDEQKVMDLIRGKLLRIMPGCSVYGISALDEWCRVSGGARPNPARTEALEKGFAAFRQDLEAAIQFSQRYFVLDRAAFAFGNTVSLVEERAAGLQAALQRDQAQLDAAVHAIEDREHTQSKEFQEAGAKLERGFEKLRREAEQWMSEFIDRVDRECIGKLAVLKSTQIRQHLPFFLRDRLRRAMEACLVAHEPAIVALLEEYATGLHAETTKVLQGRPQLDKATPVPEQRWSNIQTAELVAEFLQVGFLVQLGLALFARQQKDAHAGQVAEAISKSLPTLRDEIRQQVRDSYTNVKNQLVAEWTKRHNAELQTHLEDMKQAVLLRESGAERVEESQAKLTDVRELVKAKLAFLEQFKPKVWSGLEA